jgi:hypothetical protein
VDTVPGQAGEQRYWRQESTGALRLALEGQACVSILPRGRSTACRWAAACVAELGLGSLIQTGGLGVAAAFARHAASGSLFQMLLFSFCLLHVPVHFSH